MRSMLQAGYRVRITLDQEFVVDLLQRHDSPWLKYPLRSFASATLQFPGRVEFHSFAGGLHLKKMKKTVTIFVITWRLVSFSTFTRASENESYGFVPH